MNNTAEAWVLYRLTHSALALGAQGLCFSAPIAVLPLLTGALADRFDRLSLVKMTLVAEAAQAFAIAGLAAMGDLRAWVLYLAAGLDAGRLAVNIPAQSALVPNIVPPGLLTSALALSTATWSSSALVGPAVAGALLVAVGPALVFAINGAATIVALAQSAPSPCLPPDHGRQMPKGRPGYWPAPVTCATTGVFSAWWE
jgi:MFS family permease